MRKVIVRRVRSARPAAAAPRPSYKDPVPFDPVSIRQFDPTLLELGDLSAPCQEKEAIATIFDLTGFTRFCNQADAHLAIPRFLSDFLDWIFNNIRLRISERAGNGDGLCAELPIMVKFLGDGLLILWNTRHMNEEGICRITVSLLEITWAYRREFYPRMSAAVNKPPAVLRCAMARGKVFSIGGGRDYVGHCVNTASRLSHLGLSFCFPHRGFQVRDYMPARFRGILAPKSVSIRGLGDDELIWVVREELERLPPENKAMFRDLPGIMV